MWRDASGALSRRVPVVAWARSYRRSWLRGDVAAGLVVAVMVVPQGLAYASLAGMPPVTGLYAAVVPLVVYAALGSSAWLSVGPSAISALLVASSLATMAPDPAAYIALAGLLAVLTGAIRIVMGLLRLGALSNFVSQPVISGFTSAAALVIALSQAGELLGVDVDRPQTFVSGVRELLAGVVNADAATMTIAALCIGALAAAKLWSSRLPGALLVAVAATAASWLLDLGERGVAILGPIPSGLPAPALPPLDAATTGALLPAAVALALIGYVEGMSVAKSLAVRNRQRYRPNQELLALGFASAAAGIFRGFPIGASLSRTAAAHDAGGRTQLTSLVAAVAVAVVAAVATPLLFYLPQAVLAAIVVVAVANLFRISDGVTAARTSRGDGAVWLATFAATVALPVEWGLLAGIALSLGIFLYRATRPHMAELGAREGAPATYRKADRDRVHRLPHVALLRMDGPLYFMNADSFVDRVQQLWVSRPEVRVVVIDTSAITGLDATGVDALRRLLHQADDSGIDIHLATVRGPFRRMLQRTELLGQLEPARIHTDVAAAVHAIESSHADGRGLRRQPGSHRPVS